MKSNYRIDNQCIAEITVKKNSIKKYNNDYYLKSGQEFEILLRNNTQDVVLATIKLNGKRISSSGIVLNPGQKVNLERYLDENKKFIFETYRVDNSTESLRAIENNGNIEVQFYKEKTVLSYYNQNDYWSGLEKYRKPNNPYDKPYWYGSSQVFNSVGLSGTTNTLYASATNVANNITATYTSYSTPPEITLNSVETGRVGKGGTSNQSFTNYSGQFESYPFKTISLKILPYSLKPLEVRDLAEYCTECGTKNRKGNYKFCPSCGNRF